MSYLDELSRELGAVGIRGSRRRRILAEVDDHLRSGGDVASFGSPQLVAQRFADELATVRTCRSAYVTFAALAPAGLAYAGLFATLGRSADITTARTLPFGLLAAAVMLFAPQVAFAAGALAVLRAWRLSGSAPAPAAELGIVHRRVGVALASGALTLAAIVVFAYEYSATLSHVWIVAAVTAGAATLLPLVPAACFEAGARRLRCAVAGSADDLTSDVEPAARFLPDSLRTPWWLCFGLCAVVALVAIAAAGPVEGTRNAVAETLVICAAFAALGPYLGLRH